MDREFCNAGNNLGGNRNHVDLRQTGDNIRGELYDQMRSRSDYFGNSVVILGEQIPIDIRRKFEQLIRRFGTETVPNSRLPDTSDLRGTITGSQVRFTKTYRGLETTDCRASRDLPARWARCSILREFRSRPCGSQKVIMSGTARSEPSPQQARVSLEKYRGSEGGTTKRAGTPLCRYPEVPQRLSGLCRMILHGFRSHS